MKGVEQRLIRGFSIPLSLSFSLSLSLSLYLFFLAHVAYLCNFLLREGKGRGWVWVIKGKLVRGRKWVKGTHRNT